MNELTFPERNEYSKIVLRMDSWSKSTVIMAEDLKTVRDKKLYREEFKTFKEFCHSKCGLHIRKAQRVLKELNEPKKLEMRQMSQNSDNSNQNNQSEEIIDIETDSEVFDKTEAKVEVPKSILADWKRADEVGRDITRKVSELKCFLENGKKEDDIIFRELSITAAAYATNLYTAVKSIAPYSVCTSCQGHQSNKCSTCKGRGFFSKDFYDRAIPEEVKALRNRINR